MNILEGELNIHPAIPSSELIWVAGNDIHYVFSVEIIPYSLGWPRRTLYFLPPTFSDKQKWVSALEYVADEVKKTTQKEGHVRNVFEKACLVNFQSDKKWKRLYACLGRLKVPGLGIWQNLYF